MLNLGAVRHFGAASEHRPDAIDVWTQQPAYSSKPHEPRLSIE